MLPGGGARAMRCSVTRCPTWRDRYWNFSGGWLTLTGIRVTNRIGQGLRTARVAMLADAVRDGTAVRAFGFTRALDHAGAVLGALAAVVLVYWGAQRLELGIARSALPA